MRIFKVNFAINTQQLLPKSGYDTRFLLIPYFQCHVVGTF